MSQRHSGHLKDDPGRGTYRMHTLILGGTKSGKSAHALMMGERLISKEAGNPGSGLFIATAQAGDAEMKERIRRHRAERGRQWQTVEEPVDITGVLQEQSDSYRVIVIDCLTLWVSNLMYQAPGDVEDYCAELCRILPRVRTPVIMVSNEVGLGIVPTSTDARKFRDYAGKLHQDIAGVCTTVIFTVAGIPMLVKGEDSA